MPFYLFSIQLNFDLSIPLTAAEIAVNASSSPATERLTRYNFEFVPAVIGSGSQTVYLKLANKGTVYRN